MRNVWILGVFWLAACTKPAETDETDDTDDTDIVDDGLFDLRATLVVDAGVTVPTGNVRAALIPMLPRENGPWTFGAPTTEAPLSGVAPGANTPFKLRFNPEPDASLFFPVEEGLEIAPFGIGVYVDADANEVRGPADPLVGATYQRMVMFVRGTIPETYTALGAAAGWNLVDISFTEGGGPTRFVPLTDDAVTDYEVDANLLPQNGDDLALTVNASSSGDARVGLYSFVGQVDPTAPDPADPTLISVSADLSSTGAVVTLPTLPTPPADHYTDKLGDMPPGLVMVSIYLGVAWNETSGDEDFDPDTETALVSSVYGENDVQFVVNLIPSGYEAAAFSEAFGWPMGWSMIHSSEGGSPIVVAWDSGLPLGVAL